MLPGTDAYLAVEGEYQCSLALHYEHCEPVIIRLYCAQVKA